MDIKNSTILFTQIASIATFVLSLFGLYRALITQKDATIELLKEKNTYLKDQIENIQNNSSDVLLNRITSRYKVSLEELERLTKDHSSTKELLECKQNELADMKQMMKSTVYFSTHDHLTGLYNKQNFIKVTKQLFDIKNKSSCLALLFLNIDNFRSVNEAHGHFIGDELLVMLSKRLKNAVENESHISRFGGDEFLMIIEYTEPFKLKSTLNELLCMTKPSYLIRSIEINIGISIGVALHPKHGNEFEETLMAADMALYRAKKNNRGNYAIYNEEHE